MSYKPVVLVILDGYGYSEKTEHNAIYKAHTSYINSLWQDFPHALLSASGESLGLPEGQIGSSEIGHTTIGLGKIMDNDLVRINKSITSGEFGKNVVFNSLFQQVREHNSTLHVLGMLSPGGVHSHSDHLYAFIKLAVLNGIQKLAVHVFTDGRDTPPQSSIEYLKELEHLLSSLGVGLVATVSGRYFGMDRDNNWDRIIRAEEALFLCKGNVCQNKKPSEYVAELHAEGHLDEHLEPVVFLDTTGAGVGIAENDGVFFTNFRADRARQLTHRLYEQTKGKNIYLATMTEYDPSVPVHVAFPPEAVGNTLASTLARAGKKQLHIAETEKYAHVTYFFNGGVEDQYPGESRILVDSRKDVKTHDLAPDMKASEITDAVLNRLDTEDFVVINYANADMVGHTANFEATVKAVEAIDWELARLVPAVVSKGGAVIITADHGNAEQNVDPETGVKHTAHTLNPVPCIIVSGAPLTRLSGTLADVAPTVLMLLGVPKPSSMTGEALINLSKSS